MSLLRTLITRIGSINFRQSPQPYIRTARRNFCEGNQTIFEVTNSEEYGEKVIEQSYIVPVLVDFYADWCGPCKNLGPRLEEKIRNQNGSILLGKVNVDTAGDVAADLGVSAVPTVFAFANGEEAGHFSGDHPDEALEKFIDKVVQGDTPATI